MLPGADTASVLVRPCPDPKFGDYQSNALMALAKERKLNPRQLATDVVAKLDVAEWCEKPEIAGAGFLNFRLKPEALASALNAAVRGEHLFFEKSRQPQTAVIDFGSPNVAKLMHVGHIRSTFLGDALARILRLLGHRVVTDNHIGDWGTQFGMLLFGWKRENASNPEKFAAALKEDSLAELEKLYKKITAECEAHPETQQACREELVKLQQGDPENLRIWELMTAFSRLSFEHTYQRLNIKFDHTYGESFYNPWLGAVVADLLARGIARESAGAVAVFSDGSLPPKEDPFLVNRDGEWVPDPALVRKSDGGFNYTTTDLATIDYRIKTWSPQEIVYVVDDRQSPHFKKLFIIFNRWQPDAAKKVKLVHVNFGKILGDDGKPFKTRSGDTVKLGELLDEAEERAFKIVSEKNADLTESQRKEIARVVAIGAIKYADLSPNRQTDYVFSWDKMLALNGNTAPYLLFAYARTQGIFAKGEIQIATLPKFKVSLAAPEEFALARHFLNFGLVLEAVAADYRPNLLCSYLYDLAAHFARFFENCPVLKAEPSVRDSRLALCQLTARVLKQGLEVLGIETLEQM